MTAMGHEADDLLHDWIQGLGDPDYLAALKDACQDYEETLSRRFADRHQRELASSDLRSELDRVRFARGCVSAFADGGFDALFDFRRDFPWRNEGNPDI